MLTAVLSGRGREREDERGPEEGGHSVLISEEEDEEDEEGGMVKREEEVGGKGEPSRIDLALYSPIRRRFWATFPTAWNSCCSSGESCSRV